MYTNKANAICLLNVLREFSDESHIMPMREILAKMASLYDVTPDRRTVYSAIDTLASMGFDISSPCDNNKGYYLRSREISREEARLLMDAVYSFPFISQKETASLIKKLQQPLSVYDRKKYKHLSIVREDKKSQNREVFRNIDLLDSAISDKVKVSFSYLRYDVDKALKPRRKEKYTVNPYGMIYTNEHYYLICIMSGMEKTSLYRIDRMAELAASEEQIDQPPHGFDYRREVKDASYAHAGKPELISMRCSRQILSDVIDRFGTGIWVKEQDEETIRVRFTAPPRGVKYWALQYIEHVEIVEPEWLRNEVIRAISKNRYGSRRRDGAGS
ncbi:MAG: WYL domain-containing protein [Synergistaceae bacterium]|nr:WYL domain-containing protein [Synergistaceae bacterium]